MGKWKTWIGVVLIALSAAGLIFWEVQGREQFMTEAVLVAAAEIPAGTVITSGAFITSRVQKDSVVSGALKPENGSSLTGRRTRVVILKNQQIASAYFAEDGELPESDQSFYVLPQDWIAMRSSSLRKGDLVSLYGGVSLQKVGEYRVAFVKDQSEQEVTDPGGGKKPEALDRTMSTSEISHLELVTTLSEYGRIRQAVVSEGGILVVQEPELTASRAALSKGGKGAVRAGAHKKNETEDGGTGEDEPPENTAGGESVGSEEAEGE